MRGSPYLLLVVAVFAGILLRAVNIAYPSNPAGQTVAVKDTLDVLSPFAGELVLLVAVGALISLTFARMAWADAGGGF